MQRVHGNTVLAFPRRKKRAPKAHNGQSAEIVVLPTSDRLLADIIDATNPVEKMMAMMAWRDRKYGANRPEPAVLINDMNEDILNMVARCVS